LGKAWLIKLKVDESLVHDEKMNLSVLQVGLQGDKHRRAQRVEVEDGGGLHNHTHIHTIVVRVADTRRAI